MEAGNALSPYATHFFLEWDCWEFEESVLLRYEETPEMGRGFS